MTDSARYVKIVEWSDEDQCFVGHCPGVIGPCCHGDDEVEVYRELCQIVEEWLEIAHQENRPLPQPTSKAKRGQVQLESCHEIRNDQSR